MIGGRPARSEAVKSGSVSFLRAARSITSITNGVHVQSWASLEIAELYDRHLGEGWRYLENGENVWQQVHQIPDRELWETHQIRRGRLIEYARVHLRNQLSRQGMPPAKIELSLQALDPVVEVGASASVAEIAPGIVIGPCTRVTGIGGVAPVDPAEGRLR